MGSFIKKLVAVSLSILTCVQLSVAASGYDGSDILGDVNNDGTVDSFDALMVLRYTCGLEKLTPEQIKLADFDGSGEVDVIDSLYIQRHSVGLDDDVTNITAPTYKPATPPVEYSYNNFGNGAAEDTSIGVCGTSYTLPVGKTLYLTSDTTVEWGSNCTDIAEVDSCGLVLAKAAGTVNIIALKGGRKRTVKLTVTEAEPVRCAYASPNSAAKGSTVKLIAITDNTRSAVRFDVSINGAINSVKASERSEDNDFGIITWTGYIDASTQGSFDVTVSSECNGLWTTCENGKTTMFVSGSSSENEASLNTLRASDKAIDLIAQYEGCLTHAEIDPIAYGEVMNYGYGSVIYGGDEFYNNSSQAECFADLVNEINEKMYNTYVNEYLQMNGIKYNQYQFDSLISFVYNLGVYALQNASLKSILTNCPECSTLVSAEGSSSIATVNVSDYLNIRSGAGTNYSIIGRLEKNEQVTIIDPTSVNGVWVKVQKYTGLVGYCSKDYLLIGAASTSTGDKNLANVDGNALISELLTWHHAGGKCYLGLLYRRIDELEVFFYADYTQDGYLNKHGWTYPSCIR